MAKAPEGPKETNAERANAEVMADQYRLAKGTHRLQDDTFKRLMDYRQEKARLEGQANADRQQAMRPTLVHGPNQPAAAVTGAVDRGIALGRGAADTRLAAERADVDTKLGLAGIARGEQVAAIEGIDDLARRETATAIDKARGRAAQTAMNTAAVAQGVGLAANVGSSAFRTGGGGAEFSATGTREAYNQTPAGPRSVALGDDWDPYSGNRIAL